MDLDPWYGMCMTMNGWSTMTQTYIFRISNQMSSDKFFSNDNMIAICNLNIHRECTSMKTYEHKCHQMKSF